MTVKMKKKLEVHRMRGHIPSCLVVLKDVSNRPVELQADFCFINLVTGTFVKDQPNALNIW